MTSLFPTKEEDAERKQSPGEAARTYEAMAAMYRSCGYELAELPRAPVRDRLKFVIAAADGL